MWNKAVERVRGGDLRPWPTATVRVVSDWSGERRNVAGSGVVEKQRAATWSQGD